MSTKDNTTPRPCPICREIHEPRGLSWDGIGINSCGMYRSRMATFQPDYREHGPEIVRAVNAHNAMREALRMMNADTIAARVRAMSPDPGERCEQYATLIGEIGTAARRALALADQETQP